MLIERTIKEVIIRLPVTLTQMTYRTFLITLVIKSWPQILMLLKKKLTVLPTR